MKLKLFAATDREWGSGPEAFDHEVRKAARLGQHVALVVLSRFLSQNPTAIQTEDDKKALTELALASNDVATVWAVIKFYGAAHTGKNSMSAFQLCEKYFTGWASEDFESALKRLKTELAAFPDDSISEYTTAKKHFFKGQTAADLVPEGLGSLSYENGDFYIGHWKTGYQSGFGCFAWRNGDRYVGHYKLGIRDGMGKLRWTSGSTTSEYTGQFQRDQMNGQGHLTSPGTCYDGSMLNNLRHGFGTLTWGRGLKYTGEWQLDKFDGAGTLTYADGGTHKGQFKNNKRDGPGVYTNAREQVVSGEWVEDSLVKKS